MFDLPVRDTVVILATALAGALLVGLPGAFALRLLRSRSITVHIAALLVVTLAAAYAGVFGIARAMFISIHDRNVLFVVLTGSGAVSLLIGWWLGHRLAADAVWADQIREQERRAEARRRELVAWVSHDLRTPLAGLRAMAEALEDGVVTDRHTTREYLRRIRTETDRMAELVDDLFEMSRINAGALRLSITPVPLRDVVSEAHNEALGAHPPSPVPGAEVAGFQPGGRSGGGLVASSNIGERCWPGMNAASRQALKRRIDRRGVGRAPAWRAADSQAPPAPGGQHHEQPPPTRSARPGRARPNQG